MTQWLQPTISVIGGGALTMPLTTKPYFTGSVFSNGTTQTITTQSTYTSFASVILDTTVVQNFTNDTNRIGFTYTGTTTRFFLINFDITLGRIDAGTDRWDTGFWKNATWNVNNEKVTGTFINNSGSGVELLSTALQVTLGGSFIVSLAQNDIVSLTIRNTTSTRDISTPFVSITAVTVN